jgi:phosphoribosylaminoimidazole-succinocarboxamide synthase
MGRLSAEDFDRAADAAMRLFDYGAHVCRERGLILVDTKYEFGTDASGKIWVIDEIHTPDSSRYWIAEGSEERFRRGEEQRMLDKEFVRQWLIRERNYKGEGPLPQIPDEVRVQLASRYAELVQTLTGEAPRLVAGDTRARIEKALAAGGYV